MKRWKTPNELVTLKKPKRARHGGLHTERECSQTERTEKANSELSLQSDDIALNTSAGTSAGTDLPPQDWCLKSKVRISSKQEFSWLNSSKPHHEAKAFAMAHMSEKLPNALDEVLVSFHQSRIVWMHPSYPVTELFPRMASKLQNVSAVSERDARSMKDDWSTSFDSVFQLLQCGYCPYFYVCADSVTILFISEEIVKPQGLALLTPTTPGFRDVLRKQGIAYEVPLVETCADVKQEYDDLEGTDSWFKTVTARDTKRSLIFADAMELRPDSENTVSLVSVQGTEFCGLANFILNHKTMVSSSGKFANILPTLLSPVQFVGATMSCLKIKRNKVQVSEGGDLTELYHIDLNGPVLPHTVQKLKNTLDLTRCSIQFQDYERTSSFNQFFKQSTK